MSDPGGQRAVRGSEEPIRQLVGLGYQIDGQEGSQRVSRFTKDTPVYANALKTRDHSFKFVIFLPKR